MRLAFRKYDLLSGFHNLTSRDKGNFLLGTLRTNGWHVICREDLFKTSNLYCLWNHTFHSINHDLWDQKASAELWRCRENWHSLLSSLIVPGQSYFALPGTETTIKLYFGRLTSFFRYNRTKNQQNITKTQPRLYLKARKKPPQVQSRPVAALNNTKNLQKPKKATLPFDRMASIIISIN